MIAEDKNLQKALKEREEKKGPFANKKLHEELKRLRDIMPKKRKTFTIDPMPFDYEKM
eukprot:CAMPEP_0114589910 /NCGR_PEP_ID=MMETSP0125-20121206/12252_1 /TAXON_ID=485358 ORGANISM="Aristerostoma sp., Strain ATCC 50986" /NCGR_SAMPLE_ID=MMETSP0125 /ASSEMBLY_ACC=CAM_ASM_000245 /LENGTH=57 /DNA_ID=CAMNT_0001787057 /DNA_START=1104 /DNA_END=1277 /DNA_ORIENTATION=+